MSLNVNYDFDTLAIFRAKNGPNGLGRFVFGSQCDLLVNHGFVW